QIAVALILIEAIQLSARPSGVAAGRRWWERGRIGATCQASPRQIRGMEAVAIKRHVDTLPGGVKVVAREFAQDGFEGVGEGPGPRATEAVLRAGRLGQVVEVAPGVPAWRCWTAHWPATPSCDA